MRLRDQGHGMREVILAIAAARGAREVRLFGSVARGEETSASDIDLLITLEPGRSLLDLARLEADLEQLLGRRVDVVTEAGLREPMRTAALREAIRI